MELFGEGQRYWDAFRRREMTDRWNNGMRHGLMPILDLRDGTPKYVFLRINQKNDEMTPRTFQMQNYYLGIPGTDVNRLVQNPGY